MLNDYSMTLDGKGVKLFFDKPTQYHFKNAAFMSFLEQFYDAMDLQEQFGATEPLSREHNTPSIDFWSDPRKEKTDPYIRKNISVTLWDPMSSKNSRGLGNILLNATKGKDPLDVENVSDFVVKFYLGEHSETQAKLFKEYVDRLLNVTEEKIIQEVIVDYPLNERSEKRLFGFSGGELDRILLAARKSDESINYPISILLPDRVISLDHEGLYFNAVFSQEADKPYNAAQTINPLKSYDDDLKFMFAHADYHGFPFIDKNVPRVSFIHDNLHGQKIKDKVFSHLKKSGKKIVRSSGSETRK